MPKSKRRAGARRPQQERRSPEADLLGALREGVDSPTPGSLLGSVGLLLSVAAGAEDPAGTFEELVGSFSGVARVETSAALLAMATLAVDPELRRRVRREIAERGHVLPRWLAQLDQSEPAGRAVEISTVFRDVDELVVGVVVPGGHPLTAVVEIANEWGAVAIDSYVAESPLDAVVDLLTEDDEPDTRVRDISPADARARIAHALTEIDLGPGHVSTDQLVEARPLIEWMLSLLPEGGEDDAQQDLSDDELAGIADRFLAGPFGSAWSDAELRPLVDEVVVSGSANGIGDPLVWSEHNVHTALDPAMRAFETTTPHLDRAPDVLRDLIRHGHAERGLRPELTDIALRAVDAAEETFRASLRG
jgi:hypothetical protein